MDRPHCFCPVQLGWEYVGIYNSYESHAFLRISSEYMISYMHFSVNLSPPLSPSLCTFLLRHGLFLGRSHAHYVPPKPFVQRFNDR